MGWTNGTGVWVLEPNKTTFNEYEKLTKAEPSLSYNDRLKKGGGKFYDHWEQHPDTLYIMGGSNTTSTPVRRAEVKDSFPGVPKRDVGVDSFPGVPKRDIVKDSFPVVPQHDGVEGSSPLIAREDDGTKEKAPDSFEMVWKLGNGEANISIYCVGLYG